VTETTKRSKLKKGAGALKNHSARHAGGFLAFLRSQGVVGLAVGLVLGGAVSTMVKSLIDNIVMPPLGFLLGSADGLKGLAVAIGKTEGGKQAVLHYGVFLNDLVNFLVIALTIYMVVHLLRFDKLDKAKG
jgi:large conductance mechanosensitive channel